MVMVGRGACDETCRKQLFAMRQLRLMQGKEMDRIERVWLITDEEPLDTLLIREYDGTHMLRARRRRCGVAAGGGRARTPADHIYMIDPLGHLMMRFPKDPELPRKVYKDLAKLLKASVG
jgi:hypothetical protein